MKTTVSILAITVLLSGMLSQSLMGSLQMQSVTDCTTSRVTKVIYDSSKHIAFNYPTANAWGSNNASIIINSGVSQTNRNADLVEVDFNLSNNTITQSTDVALGCNYYSYVVSSDNIVYYWKGTSLYKYDLANGTTLNLGGNPLGNTFYGVPSINNDGSLATFQYRSDQNFFRCAVKLDTQTNAITDLINQDFAPEMFSPIPIDPTVALDHFQVNPVYDHLFYFNHADGSEQTPYRAWVYDETEGTFTNVYTQEASKGADSEVIVKLDLISSDDTFNVTVDNNSVNDSIVSVAINTGSQVIDYLQNGSSVTVSPNGGGNNDGITEDEVVLTFSGSGLAAGASASTGMGDIDGIISSLTTTVTMASGKVYAGSFGDVGDSDDGNPVLYQFNSIETVEVYLDYTNASDGFNVIVVNNSNHDGVDEVVITTDSNVIDTLNGSGSVSVSHGAGSNNDGIKVSEFTLTFPGGNLSPGSTAQTGSGDIDGNVSWLRATIQMTSGRTYTHFLRDVQDDDDANPALFTHQFEISAEIITVQLDYLDANDKFKVVVDNHTHNDGVEEVIITSDESVIDTLAGSTSVLVSHSAGSNNDGIKTNEITLTFPGGSLAPGASGQTSHGDIDGDVAWFRVTVNMTSGKSYTHFLSDSGDNDDSNSTLYTHEFTISPETIGVYVDYLDTADSFKVTIENNTSNKTVHQVRLTADSSVIDHLAGTASVITVDPDGGSNNDGQKENEVYLNIINGLPPGSSITTAQGDIDGTVAWLTADIWTYAPDPGSRDKKPSYRHTLQNLGDTDDANPILYGNIFTNPSLAEYIGHEMWSADGKHLYGVKYKHSPIGPRGLLRTSETGRLEQLVESQLEFDHLATSPESRYIVTDVRVDSIGSGDTRRDIVLIDTETGVSTTLARVDTWPGHPGHAHPSFSPDGDKVIFTMKHNGNLAIGIQDVTSLTP